MGAGSFLQRWLLEEEVSPNDYNATTIDEFNNYSSNDNAGDNYGAYDDGYAKGPAAVDFSVLSVGVMTLGLILFVEVSRHTLDHAAHHKPFFKTVLEMVYSELATLGLVELFIFLLLKYYDNINKERKEVFGDVHFALFYTAIFNAFQTVLVAVVARASSYKQWVHTEQLELDHYVEIREEFERLQEEYHLRSTYRGIGPAVATFAKSFLYTGLRKNRYQDLLVQVRFHELRLYFLEQNGLPLTLKVSDYLKRSELRVLISLVHISGMAWLFLTGGLNLIYFAMGMVSYGTGDSHAAGVALTWIFFSLMFLFILICLLLYVKMRNIFRAILEMEHATSLSSEADMKAGRDRQRALFWFGEPQLVISIIQFMQFGYALALAIVIMYWPHLTGAIKPYFFLLTVVGCNGIFVFVLGKVLPQYTLCTSLGYLVDQTHLQETVALHRLHDAQRMQRCKMLIEYEFDDDLAICETSDSEDELTMSASSMNANLSDSTGSSGIGPIAAPSTRNAQSNISILAQLVKSDTSTLRGQLPENSLNTLSDREARLKMRRANRKKSVSDGVAAMQRMNTVPPTVQSLRQNGVSPSAQNAQSTTPAPAQNTSLSKEIAGSTESKMTRSQRLASRRANRKKSQSTSGIIQSWQDDVSATKQRREKTPSDSDVIASWQNSLRNVTVDPPTGDGPAFVLKAGVVDDIDLSLRQQREARKAGRNRQKALSASAVIQSWQNQSVGGDNSRVGSAEFGLRLKPSLERQDSPILSTLNEVPRESGLVEVVDLAAATLLEEKKVEHSENRKAVSFGPPEGSIHSSDSVGELSYVKEAKSEAGTSNYGKSSTGELDNFTHNIQENLKPQTVVRRLREHYLTSTYEVLSHVFGTMVVFFLIGMRVEAMIVTTEALDKSENTWELRLGASFWWQASCYISFLTSSITILCLFPLNRLQTYREWRLVIATILDLLLSAGCLSILFYGEAQRCCSVAQDVAALEIAEDSRCCPFWGRRTHGGLGTIEPFTSLIALRVVRFTIAKAILNVWNSTHSKQLSDNQDPEDAEKESTSDGKGNDHEEQKGMLDASGTPLELWEKAIGKYPDVVLKYGQFSGELFQVMLGLELPEEPEIKPALLDDAEECQPAKSNESPVKQPHNEKHHTRVKLSNKLYCDMPTEAQGFIVAGKLGKPVKSVAAHLKHSTSRASLPTLAEDEEHTLTAEFEIDDARLQEEAKYDLPFVAPNARLVRSMRRCDRRLLPLLQEWHVVDVVITQFEIVYFDAHDSTNMGTEDEQHRQQNMLIALKATKGGQGLRLRDVADGRKVVGHFDLGDVTEVHIERDIPVEDQAHLEEIDFLHDTRKELPSEYWTKESTYTRTGDTRQLRWAKIKEDRLRLSSVHGTLFLRFYSDLDDIESHLELSMMENEKSGRIMKDIAFQWAQTVSHICGKHQLKQALPHYGEDNSDELRDYLEVVHYHDKESEDVKKHHRRMTSANQILSPYGLRPMSSFGDTIRSVPKRFTTASGEDESSTPPRPARMSLRRLVSSGDADTGSTTGRAAAFGRQQSLEADGDDISRNAPTRPGRKSLRRLVSAGDADATRTTDRWPMRGKQQTLDSDNDIV